MSESNHSQLEEEGARLWRRIKVAAVVMWPHWKRFFVSLRHPIYRNDKGRLKTSLHDFTNIWTEFCGSPETKWLAGHLWMLQTIVTVIGWAYFVHALARACPPTGLHFT